MSDLLSKASLVMIPSGYKEDVVYSPVPTDGSGDLSFTRASNGTRINSAGLVEDCPWNLLTYSEEFNNAAWVKSNVTVTANTTTAPNGTLTADTLVLNSSGGYLLQTPSITFGIGFSVTLSIYAKNQISNFLIYGGATAAGNDVYTIQDVGNGWYRHTNTRTFTASGTQIQYLLFNFTGTQYIWGAQLNIGSTAKPYFPTTDRLNVPRLTYQNGGGGCPSLLLEKQSTNLLTYSEQFDNAAWVKSSGSVTANQATSPDGTQNADLIAGEVYQQKTQANATTYTMSVFAKKQSATTVYIGYIDNVTGFAGGSIVYTYSTGAITVNQSANSSVSGKAIDMGNGWIRLSITYTTIALVTFNYQYIGSTGSYIYGAQLEVSNYPTSYISTQAASATRVADTSTTSLSSSIVNASEGVLFLDYQPLNVIDSFPVDFQLQHNGSNATNGVTIFHSGATPSVSVRSGGSVIFSASLTATTAGTRNKIAIAYKGSDYAVYQNGVQKATQLSGVAPAALNQLRVSDGTRNYSINQALVFPTRLTNAELQSLTTL